MKNEHITFKKIYIEITNACNLNCSFCTNRTRSLQFLTMQGLKVILEQIKPYTKYIYFHVLGEPTMHPKLSEFLDLSRSYGFYVQITTNASYLEQNWKILCNGVRQVNISLHSYTQQHVDWQTYIKRCLYYGEKLAQHDAYVSYRMWNLSNGNLDETSLKVIQMIASYYQKNIQLYKNIQLANRQFLHFDEVFEWPSLDGNFVSDVGTCYGTRSMCAILVDGTVVPCCLDAKGSCNLGNINDKAFVDIVNSVRFQQMKSGFQNHTIMEDLCKRCQYRQRFEK